MDMTTQSRVDQWLHGAYDEESKRQIRSLMERGSEKDLIDAFYKDLEFGTGGLRGLMGPGTNRMNRYTVGMATQGLFNYLAKSFPGETIKVAIAHDSRNNSDYFARVTADVFTANGAEVYFFRELRPTPELSFSIRELGCHSGVVITASHNPKEYNGYKAYWQDGAQMVAPHDKNVIAEVKNIKDPGDVKFTGDESKMHYLGENIDQKYLDRIAGLSVFPDVIQRQKDLSIVYTPIHGTGITMVPKVLARVGFTNVHVVEEQAQPDGNFPTVIYPNPEESEAMSMAVTKAKNLNADLVMATDPDSDRVGAAAKNHKGEWQLLNGNQTASLIFYYLLEAWQQAGKLEGREYIVKTVVTTDLLADVARHYGVEVYDVLTGFKFIAAIMKENEGKKTFIAGGEESYGYLVGDFVRDKDAIISCAMIAEVTAYAKDKNLSLFDLLLEIYMKFGFYKEKLISLTRKGKEGAEEIQQMMADLRANPPETINGSKLVRLIDYEMDQDRNLLTGETRPTGLPKSNVLQFITEDGSKISARPSGTEPKIKFYFSVREKLESRDAYEQVSKQLDDRVQGIIDSMKLH
ncbi:phosphoglucomutase [Catalinimonas alkaloidigena]|uniref:Phosphoglucomutase n=1 Tax=Catalinimonas alkaloidigena TaxID=1075417 RepID=A0A1G9KVA5_9BACT|nr:phosphoglucomutase [Catalinimonas alkaloidigena]